MDMATLGNVSDSSKLFTREYEEMISEMKSQQNSLLDELKLSREVYEKTKMNR
jgi:hypothetical protein